MDQELQDLIQCVCSGFTTHDVRVSQIFDVQRFAKMTHYAWKHEIGFHPEMFKKALRGTEVFRNLSEEELDEKSRELCRQADLAKDILRVASEIEKN